MTVHLREVAHTRAGDKGDISDIAVFAYDSKDYEALCQQVTVERVEVALEGIVDGPVTRYEVPNLDGLKFVIENALDGGVTTSLRMDSHGKSLSSAILALEIEMG